MNLISRHNELLKTKNVIKLLYNSKPNNYFDKICNINNTTNYNIQININKFSYSSRSILNNTYQSNISFNKFKNSKINNIIDKNSFLNFTKFNYSTESRKNRTYKTKDSEDKQNQNSNTPLEAEIIIDPEDNNKESNSTNYDEYSINKNKKSEFDGTIDIDKFNEQEYIILNTNNRRLIEMYIKFLLPLVFFYLILKYGIYRQFKKLFKRKNVEVIPVIENKETKVETKSDVNKDKQANNESNNTSNKDNTNSNDSKDSNSMNNNTVSTQVSEIINKETKDPIVKSKNGILTKLFSLGTIIVSGVALVFGFITYTSNISYVLQIVRKITLSSCGKKIKMYFILPIDHSINIKQIKLLSKEELYLIERESVEFIVNYGYPLIVSNDKENKKRSKNDFNNVLYEEDNEIFPDDLYVIWNKANIVDRKVFNHVISKQKYIKVIKD